MRTAFQNRQVAVNEVQDHLVHRRRCQRLEWLAQNKALTAANLVTVAVEETEREFPVRRPLNSSAPLVRFRLFSATPGIRRTVRTCELALRMARVRPRTPGVRSSLGRASACSSHKHCSFRAREARWAEACSFAAHVDSGIRRGCQRWDCRAPSMQVERGVDGVDVAHWGGSSLDL
jgi:hypothetical protein